jgi:hypothetical protein
MTTTTTTLLLLQVAMAEEAQATQTGDPDRAMASLCKKERRETEGKTYGMKQCRRDVDFGRGMRMMRVHHIAGTRMAIVKVIVIEIEIDGVTIGATTVKMMILGLDVVVTMTGMMTEDIDQMGHPGGKTETTDTDLTRGFGGRGGREAEKYGMKQCRRDAREVTDGIGMEIETETGMIRTETVIGIGIAGRKASISAAKTLGDMLKRGKNTTRRSNRSWRVWRRCTWTARNRKPCSGMYLSRAVRTYLQEECMYQGP